MRELSSGQELCGRFTLLGKLGSGGHGEVWRAREHNSRRDIALKVLFPTVAALPGAFAGLEREYRISCRLPFPGILRVHPPVAGRDATVLPMAIAVGGDLRRLRGADSLQIVPLLIELARALEAAHAHGVVHRDLKPGNVLLDAAGRVLLADFGVAALDGESPPRRIGSPFSSSPQQLMGKPATPADDMYGFGTLAYELLSGFPPFYPHFEPQRVLTTAVPELRAAHECPVRLTTLVMRLLAKRPGDRPPSMAAVIEALEESLSDTLPFETVAGTGAPLSGVSPPETRRLRTAEPTLAPGESEVGRSVEDTLPPSVADPPERPVRPAVTRPAAAPAAAQIDVVGPRLEPGRSPPDPVEAPLPVPPGAPHFGWIEPIPARRWPYVLLVVIMFATAATLVILARLGPQSRQALESALRPASEASAERLVPLRLRFERRLGELADRDADLWGGAAFRAARATAAGATAAFDRGDFATAASLWQAGTRDLAEVEARAPSALTAELEAGDHALAAGDATAAARAFAIARRIEPGDGRALAGYEHARSLGAAVDATRNEATAPASRASAGSRAG